MNGWAAYQDHCWAQESAERLKRRISELEHERDRYREALERIEAMAGAGGSGEIPATGLALVARAALATPVLASAGKEGAS